MQIAMLRRARPASDALRDGTWVTAERMRLWAIAILIASLGGIAYLFATAHGVMDYQGRPIGTDFSNVYAAGTYVRDGRADLPFSPAAQHAREQALFGAATPFYGWHYPPFFLFLAGALAFIPYLGALAVWQGVTLALYLGVIAAIARAVHRDAAQPDRATPLTPTPLAPWLLLAAAFPAVFVNLGHGHNGFLTAALIGAALLLIDRRPIVAGILIGLLAYKPQFGVMIPLALMASGRWRTFAAATATVIGLIALTTWAFGVDVWTAFFASTHFTRVVVLESGNTGWHKIQSMFSWVRMWGGSVSLAYVAQGITTMAMAGIVVWVWRAPVARPLQAAVLVCAAYLGTPYTLDYDMMILAVAIAFLVAHGLSVGFAPWQKTTLALLWIVPLVARSIAQVSLVPIGVLTIVLALAVTLRRVADEAAGSTLPART